MPYPAVNHECIRPPEPRVLATTWPQEYNQAWHNICAVLALANGWPEGQLTMGT
jgi:hypothetical protein